MQARFTHPFIKALSFIAGAPKSKTKFNGVGVLPTYISFARGADDTSDLDEWISYSR
jgi:capsule polysaccharide export protein KpsE/RkpR